MESPAPEYEHLSINVPPEFFNRAVSPLLFQMYSSLR
jgi:hypothetical protein